jgi:hypothetical protein
MGQYDRVSWQYKQLTRRQRQALRHADDLIVERYGQHLQILQGSWRPETSYSGKTHTLAGVVDVYVYGMASDDELRQGVTRILRREARQAAFTRGPFVDMPWHWHVCDLDTTRMHADAAWQVAQYRLGNDGLVYGRDDPYPYRPNPIRKWRYKG